jgi:hypothetical protein
VGDEGRLFVANAFEQMWRCDRKTPIDPSQKRNKTESTGSLSANSQSAKPLRT